jgi:hypothetical protein
MKDPNILGFKGPRRMTTLVPRITKDGEAFAIQPNTPLSGQQMLEETLLDRLKRNDQRDILALQNKAPQWNDGKRPTTTMDNIMILGIENRTIARLMFLVFANEHA